jgi:hypothetical protein
MAELLAAEFTGQGGPRAIDPSSVLRAFSRAGGDDGQLSTESALRLAHDLGAEQVLVGAVVGTPRQVTFTASILAVPSGAVRVPAVTVVGPEDSLASMLGSVSGRLLSRATGAWRLSARDPGTTSAEAVRAFLAGREAYRIARRPDAGATELSRALRLDSSFVLAAYWLTVSAALFNPVPDIDAIRRVAWRDRARLGAEQRRLLEAIIGPAGPDVADSRARELAAIERVVAKAPQSFDAWLLLGDTYFHLGALLGYRDWQARSKQAFGRALALDTTVNVVGHLAMLAFVERDMASHARWLALLDRMAPTSQPTLLSRYLDAVAVGKPGEVQVARERFAGDADYSGYAWGAGLKLPAREAESLLGELQRSATTPTRLAEMPRLVKMIAANGGQPARAAEARRRFFGDDSLEHDLDILMWGERDSAAAERLARALPALGDHREAWRFPCEIALSRLRRADTTGVGTMMAALIGASAPDAWLCGRLIGLLGTDVKSGASLASVFRADSLIKSVPDGMAPTWTYDVAVALARRGQWGAAAAAARRRPFSRPARLALSLRDEGRWAALAGDTIGAVAAFRHYLVLREHPEPALALEVDSVRAELSRLLISRPR